MDLTPLRQLTITVVGYLSESTWMPILLARLVVGVEFFLSGRGKLASLEELISSFESWGIPLAHLQAPFVATVELIGEVDPILRTGVRHS